MRIGKAHVHRLLVAAAFLAALCLPGTIADTSRDPSARTVPFGVFLASDARGTERLPAFESWLGGREATVGRTYLPGDNWLALQGPEFILGPWTRWRAEKPGRVLALNVPMVAPNEGRLPDPAVAALLGAGAGGAFDLFFRTLATRLVAGGAADTIIVLGWEMNGTTYSSRCAPDPRAWKAYWRRIVTTMRSVQGQRFRFDFAPSRGPDAIPWPECYPGDDVVDIIGMDTYDQPPGETFADYVGQPYGMRYHVDFARAHGKPISFPEWGLFRRGDRSEYVREMLEWISAHDVAYHSISDYCPHGIWQCPANPDSSEVFRRYLDSTPPPPRPAPMPGTLPVPATRHVSAASRSSDDRRSKSAARAAPASPSFRASAG
ncbi:glycoside hydrolase family 26 protein [Planomonospora sp. ID67723]|uniref:glycoside hydrolase family 26 protein n=1 Tax=Planomonospora sp. ID67723 TaxID=2738134 RepID=UPI0035A89602